MSKRLHKYSEKINLLSFRERALISITLFVAILLLWQQFFMNPVVSEIELTQSENEKLAFEIKRNRDLVVEVKRKIANGINNEKNIRFIALQDELSDVKKRLRLRTIELIDPDEMFNLLAELIYKDSRLKLVSLNRQEVRQAIKVEDSDEDLGIYRHVLEIKFSGKFNHILSYIEQIESLDWQLIWDSIELNKEIFPQITVTIVFSTLSTKKEWVGV